MNATNNELFVAVYCSVLFISIDIKNNRQHIGGLPLVAVYCSVLFISIDIKNNRQHIGGLPLVADICVNLLKRSNISVSDILVISLLLKYNPIKYGKVKTARTVWFYSRGLRPCHIWLGRSLVSVVMYTVHCTDHVA